MPENEAITLEIGTDQSETTKDEETIMAEPTPMELLQLESIGNIQGANTRARDSATLANNVLQFASARNFDELGTVEGKANSGVMATDVGGPTNAGK